LKLISGEIRIVRGSSTKPGGGRSSNDIGTDRRNKVLVGSPTYREGAYALDRFLANQREIQQNYPDSELVLATVDRDFVPELESLLHENDVRGKVLLYEVAKPFYARKATWNVSCGRECIRRHLLSETDADYLLSLDHDMIFDPDIINVLINEALGYDVVHSGHRVRWSDHAVAMGAGCAIISRQVLEEVRFRSVEFRNGDTLDDGLAFELALIQSGFRVKKGIFLNIDHYIDADTVRSIAPQPLGLLRRMSTSRLIRYVILKSSLLLRLDISSRLNLTLFMPLARIKRIVGVLNLKKRNL
jgi:hypothetical protein